MHPTTEEHLAAVRRLLDQVAADPGIGESSRHTLDEAARRLRRVERAGAARLPFLVADNRTNLELLAELDAIAPDIAAAVPHLDEGAELHEPAAHELNKRLRELLARAVRELPDDQASDAWRARVEWRLRDRIAADPAINRPRDTAE